MQLQLPIFPSETKLINATVGVRKQDNTVFYLHNGSPVFCHEEGDLNSYRYIMANLVKTGLCRCSELSRTLGVPVRNIQRYNKTLEEKGSAWFFNREEKRGSCHKLKSEAMAEAQQMLDEFINPSEIARKLDVTEGAIRYHIRQGNLQVKKK